MVVKYVALNHISSIFIWSIRFVLSFVYIFNLNLRIKMERWAKIY